LRRMRSGSFDVADAISLNDLRDGGASLRPSREALPNLPTVALSPTDVAHVRHGRAIAVTTSDLPPDAARAALVDGAGSLVAVAERADATWQPRVVLPDA